MEQNPRGNDLRRIQRRREFGPDPACLLCGRTDPFEFHHTAGAANDADLEGPVCLCCHARLGEDMRTLGVDLRRGPRTTLEATCAVLLGQAVFFRRVAERYQRRAEELRRLTLSLDRGLPEWRYLKDAWE